MVGFVGALVGGALKGWGTGTIEEIKQKREEKLKELDRQFQSQESALNRDVQREQIAATERANQSSLAVQKSLGEGQQANALAIANLGEAGANARTKAQLEAQERNINAQLTSAKDIAEFQSASQMKLNSRLVQVEDPVTHKKTNEYVTPDGQTIPKLKGPDGKELDWVGTDASTDAAKNYQFMIANGFDAGYAADKAFGAAGKDVPTLEAGFLKSFIDSSFTSPDETKMQEFRRLAHEAALGIVGGQPAAGPAAPAAPAAGTPDAATPAVPSSSTAPAEPAAEPDYSAIKRPEGMDDTAIIAAVKADPKLKTKPPAMVRKLLQAWGVSEAAVKAAGL